MAKMGKIYVGQPLRIKTRKELLATVRPGMYFVRLRAEGAEFTRRVVVAR